MDTFHVQEKLLHKTISRHNMRKLQNAAPIMTIIIPESENRLYLEYPFVGVGVVVWKENHFMLVQRAKPPRLGEWSIPGGRQKLGETTKDTAFREILEETSIRIKILGLIDVVDSIVKNEEGQIKYHATLIDYAALYVSGTPKAGDDAMDLGWFTLDQLPLLQIWEETSRIICESAKFIKPATQNT